MCFTELIDINPEGGDFIHSSALATRETTRQTKYGLEKITGLSPVYVRKHLKILVDNC